MVRNYWCELILLLAIPFPMQAQNLEAGLESLGLHGLRVKAMALPVASGTQHYLYAATDDSGVFRRDFSSNSPWVNLGLRGKTSTAMDIQVWGAGPAVFQSPIVAIAPDYSQGDSTLIYKLENSQWLPADFGITKEFPLFLTALASFATSGHEPPGFAFAGSAENFLYRSNTRSSYWERLRGSHDIHTPTIRIIATNQYGIRNEVWIGGDTGMPQFAPMIQKSTDLGETWQDLHINLNLGPENACFTFAFHPQDVEVVYAGMIGAVIKSLNGGDTWSFTGLRDRSPRSQVRGLALDAFNPDHVFAGGTSFLGSSWRLYESIDAGETWKEIPEPASAPHQALGIVDLVSDPVAPGTIYIATAAYGVWKYTSGTVAVKERAWQTAPGSFVLLQNRPNPFNASTEIQYQLPVAEYIRLEVYDVQGRFLRTLVDRVQAAGVHKINWDRRDHNGIVLAAGIYFYSLRVGTAYVITRKMIMF